MSDIFNNLRIQLEQQEWPNVYFFKFIVPNDDEKLALVIALFDDEGADLTLHPSKTGKYVSVSAKEFMLNVDSIIEKYEKAAQIKGVISL